MTERASNTSLNRFIDGVANLNSLGSILECTQMGGHRDPEKIQSKERKIQ